MCQCNNGYSGNGFNCSSKYILHSFGQNNYNSCSQLISFFFIDIDECVSNPCHSNANCNDTQGSFVCQCNTGYSGNGFNCSGKYVLCWYMKNVSQVQDPLLFVFEFCRH